MAVRADRRSTRDADPVADPDGAAGADEVRERGRRPPGQLRPEPPVDARRAPPDRRPQRRGGRRDRGRDRLPAHRLREVDGAEDVVEGDHVPRADRLRRLPEQRARVRARDREAARARGPAEGDVDADAALRAEPDPLAPRLPRHRGARAGGDLDVLVLLPRARPDPRPLRDGRGTRMHTRYFQAGGLAEDIPRGFFPECRKFFDWMPKAIDDYEALLSAQRDLARAHAGDRAALGGRRDRARPDPARCCARRASTGTSAGTSRTSRTTRSTSTCRCSAAATSTTATRCASTRCASPSTSSRSASTGSRDAGRAVDRGRPQGRAAAAPRAAHVDGVADPPLQDRHRGLPRARGRGVRRDRVAARRVGVLRRLRRRPEPWRVKFRAPSFVALEATATCMVDSDVADLIAIVGSLDSVMGDTDR